MLPRRKTSNLLATPTPKVDPRESDEECKSHVKSKDSVYSFKNIKINGAEGKCY